VQVAACPKNLNWIVARSSHKRVSTLSVAAKSDMRHELAHVQLLDLAPDAQLGLQQPSEGNSR
jgi:hypothetical protein